MKSIATIYKTGNGPSSSHTVGPYNAANLIKKRNPDADHFKVILYGSLAHTGDGHGTDKAICSVIPEAEIIHNTTEKSLPHPNTMDFIVYKSDNEIQRIRIMSIGGGSILVEGEPSPDSEQIYPHRYFSDILCFCKEHNMALAEYVYAFEGEKIKEQLQTCWQTMEGCVCRGLSTEGTLPGGLDLQRKAKKLFETVSYNESSDITMNRLISAFAYAVSEENACENLVVTAPTCGSCGVIPAVFYYMRHHKGFSDEEIIDALAVAGLIGNIIATNASISGAECGCQAEIGSACSMAAAGLANLYRLEPEQIEYAAEVAMEHHLGLTCDPVKGLVQIPCIERNAVAAMRAVNAVNLSRFLYATRRISFDTVVETMYRTGLDMDERYKETTFGGLAQMYGKNDQ